MALPNKLRQDYVLIVCLISGKSATSGDVFDHELIQNPHHGWYIYLHLLDFYGT